VVSDQSREDRRSSPQGHPFEDGNGRIARAIADQALAQSEDSGQRFYSVSSQIRKERVQYYDSLESAQKGDLSVTDWR
jgi:Fic family protein